jgi:circadian clock protein KaiC
MMSAAVRPEETLVATGIEGLDHILTGGLPPYSLYLVEGDPGAGKTTMGLQFLLEGARRGEKGLYVTLSESEHELRQVARSHGWSLDALRIVEITPPEEAMEPDAQLTMFHPSEVELTELTRMMLAEVERLQPTRVVLDSLSEMRLLAQSSLRYRRQILAFKQYFAGRRSTVLLLDDRTAGAQDPQLRSIAHGVVSLEQLAPEYGAERRRLCVLKLRGVQYRGGYHDFLIAPGGLRVFPRLVAAEHQRDFAREQVKSGVEALDTLLGGGLERGTSTLLMGPAGAGKSSLASQYAVAAAERGENSVFFVFDESVQTLVERAEGLGLGLQAHVAAGRVRLQQVDPAELAPGQFASLVQAAVEEGGARLVVIDSLNGYMQAMPQERFLLIQLHELLTYLGQQGVMSLLIVGQQGLIGHGLHSPVDASYLADSVLLLRYFEAMGEVHTVLSVVKKRRGRHERTLRELRLSDAGIEVGEPLRNFQGVFTGTPAFLGLQEPPARADHE